MKSMGVTGRYGGWSGRSLLAAVLLLCTALSGHAGEQKEPQGETAYVVNDYRYDPAGSGGNPDVGQSLCATRCNALSVDYRNYIEPGGWRMVKVAGNREIVVSLGTPFMPGRCICIADEYRIQANEFNRPKSQ